MTTIPAITLATQRLAPTVACTVCDTGAGRDVRAMIASDAAAAGWAVAVPVVVCAGVVAFAHFNPFGRDRREEEV